MLQIQRFTPGTITLMAFICLLPIAAFSADNDQQLLKEWVASNNFLECLIEDRLALLEKFSAQDSGKNILFAAMNSFKREVALHICEIDTRGLDLKTFLEGLKMSRKLVFHVSEKVKITSDMVFQNCTLLAMVERLCSRYQLQAFYYAGEVYFFPGAVQSKASGITVKVSSFMQP